MIKTTVFNFFNNIVFTISLHTINLLWKFLCCLLSIYAFSICYVVICVITRENENVDVCA